MQLIRRGFFETNSSSTHSLVIVPGDIILPVLTEDEKNCGVVFTKCGEYGWEQETYHDFRDKLSYLATYLKSEYGNPIEEHQKMLEKVISDTLGCDFFIQPEPKKNSWDNEYGYIDHQSIECGLNGNVFESEESLKLFLFNNESYVETDNDNH